MISDQAVASVERGYIKGEVLHVVFRNEENYYTVALVRIRKTNEEMTGKKVTVVGTLPQFEPGEMFLFYGRQSEHPRFGIQYQVEEFKREQPETKQGIIHYLSSDRFPGIGIKTA